MIREANRNPGTRLMDAEFLARVASSNSRDLLYVYGWSVQRNN